MENPYKVLGVKEDAELGQIKKAYKNLALKLHPDRIGTNHRALEQMKLVNEAYATLCTNLQRRQEARGDDTTGPDSDEIWASYSRQVEDYYKQVQTYMEGQMAALRNERDRLSSIEKELRKREEAVRIKEAELRGMAGTTSPAHLEQLSMREGFIAGCEDRLDELMMHVSRANQLMVELSQGSKAVRKNGKGKR